MGPVIVQRRDCGIQLLLPVIDNAHGAGTIKRQAADHGT